MSSDDDEKEVKAKNLTKEEIKEALKQMDGEFCMFLQTSQSTAVFAKEEIDKVAERTRKGDEKV